MANKMIIDASHPEETRVVVLRGNRVEEFDFESASKRPLRGNIYLAKVTRVEPSLQAAFVDYGGNRHGFLAFSEIHPDYYQIPVADRQALLDEEAMSHRGEDEEPSAERRSRRGRRGRPAEAEARTRDDEILSEPASTENEPAIEDAGVETIDLAHPSIEAEADGDADAPLTEASDAPELWFAPIEGAAHNSESERDALQPQLDSAFAADNASGESAEREPSVSESSHDEDDHHDDDHHEDQHHEVTTLEGGSEERVSRARKPQDDEGEPVEQIGGDALEEVPRRPHRMRRQYKIQEVIKRRQVLLVQVVKEERGNKGAALTTYLSLAGRYSVLMPNTARGGGISRKITNSQDRSRLKDIAGELDVPEGMGVILRTAGASRTKAEVKRDFEYLLRMWETVRETTLSSSAPTLVYEEGSLIKRAIRDLYSKEVDEIVVAGEAGYREARAFMRLLMPSHVNSVQPYRDTAPVFAKAGVESQLDAMFSNQVTLKSGGYIVINQTEALVAIDVNSGRSTREHNIEDTALRTNLEAADEVARQLRLRDLAGLIVVDFIDMEEQRNNRSVERRIKDALKNDRARIQVGRISHFGLLEMSRQRIRTGVLEGSTVVCAHCQGAGVVRSTASLALHALRVLEDALIKSETHDVILRSRSLVALYILNHKRANLRDLERRFGVNVIIEADDTLTGAAYHAIDRGELATGVKGEIELPPLAQDDFVPIVDEPAPEEDEAEVQAEAFDPDDASDEGTSSEDQSPEGADGEREDGEAGRRRRRRRRRRGGERLSSGEASAADAPQPADDGLAVVAEIGGDLSAPVEGEDGDTGGRHSDRRRSRRSRGGRNRFTRGGVDGATPEHGFEAPAVGEEQATETLAQVEAPEILQEASGHEPSVAHETFAAHEPALQDPAPSPAPVERVLSEPAAEPMPESAPAIEPTSERAPETAPVDPPPAQAYASEGYAAEGDASHARVSEVAAEREAAEPVAEAPAPDEPPRARRSGWWQRARATIVGGD